MTPMKLFPVNLPENSFIGVMYQDQVNSNYAYVVKNAGNWIYAGTGFVEGSKVPGIVGYEYDKVWNNGFSPPGLTVVSNSPVVGCCEGSGSSVSNSTLYTAPSGAQVFAAGTIQWAWGLDNYSANFASVGIQKTTSNILNAFGSGATSPAPTVALSPATLSFAGQRVGTASGAKTTTLTISSIGVTGADSGDYSQVNTCPLSPSTLVAGATCTISVTFAPTATGARSASVTLTDDAVSSPQNVSLSGTGTAPAASLAPSSLTFASQIVGTTSPAQAVTLTNSGSASLAIGSIGLTSPNVGDYQQTNTCPASLPTGSSCSISVTFSPAGAGSRVASVSVADDAAGSPHTVGLSGMGTASAPAVGLTPVALAFTSQTVGTTSAAQSTRLTNTGSAPLTIGSIGVAGANPGDFAQTNTCPLGAATLDAGATCTISVTFTPNAAGARSGTVAIDDDAAGSPQTVSLDGDGVEAAPAVTLTPSSLSFGSQPVGTTSVAQMTTLTNSGTAPLTIDLVSVTGANAGDFSQTNTCPVTPLTLAAGATCTISVKFTPGAAGTRSASITISDDAAGGPHAVPLTGSGGTSAIAFDKNLGTKSENAKGTKATLTTTAAAAAGSRVFVIVKWNHASRMLSSVSGGGLTWTIDRQAKDTSNFHGAIASAAAPAGLAAGTASVTTANANGLGLGWSGIDANATSTPTAPSAEIQDFGQASYHGWATSVYRIEATAGAKTVSGTWSRTSGATANVTVVAAYRAR